MAEVILAPAVSLNELSDWTNMPRYRSRGHRHALCTGRGISTSTRTTERRGIELAALFALGAGELGEEIFIHAPEDVFGAVRLVNQGPDC